MVKPVVWFCFLVLAVVLGFAYLPSGVLSQSNGPLAYWEFNEGSGTFINDISGNGNTGQIFGASWVPGLSGSALKFDGSTNYALIPDNLIKNSTVITLSAWFKTTSNGVILGCQDSQYPSSPIQHLPIIYVGSDGKLRAQFWIGCESPITSPMIVNDGKWHQAVLVGNSDTQSLYIDGNFIGSLQGPISHLSMVFNYIGLTRWDDWTSSTGYWGFFNGTIDEIRIYYQALTADQVLALYSNLPPPIPSPSLVQTLTPIPSSSPMTTLTPTFYPTSGPQGETTGGINFSTLWPILAIVGFILVLTAVWRSHSRRITPSVIFRFGVTLLVTWVAFQYYNWYGGPDYENNWYQGDLLIGLFFLGLYGWILVFTAGMWFSSFKYLRKTAFRGGQRKKEEAEPHEQEYSTNSQQYGGTNASMNNDSDPFEILGLTKAASHQEVKDAWRTLSRKWHPDAFHTDDQRVKEMASEKFRKINDAYEQIKHLRGWNS